MAVKQEEGKKDNQELPRGTEMSGLMTVIMVSPRGPWVKRGQAAHFKYLESIVCQQRLSKATF